MASPRPTICAPLEEGDMVGGLTVPPVFARSDTHCLIRCTELSKLLYDTIQSTETISTHHESRCLCPKKREEGEKHSLDIRRIHLHERRARHKRIRHRRRHPQRQLSIRILQRQIRRMLHQRRRRPLQRRQEALLVEREQRLESTEHKFPFRGGDDGLFGGSDVAEQVDGRGGRSDVDVVELLETPDVGAFGPVEQ